MAYRGHPHIWQVVVCTLGSFIWAFVVGGATSSLASMDGMALQQRQQVDTVNHFMRFRRVPHKLRKQVNSYLDYMWSCMRGINESDIMTSMPTSLRRQLMIGNLHEAPTRIRQPHFRGPKKILPRAKSAKRAPARESSLLRFASRRLRKSAHTSIAQPSCARP